ncbi:L,D-transpeptidase family protein [Alkalibacillus aidingensis]|uniref:L,D-transpeptidase family protein n=1 Tax=Alkalibacillus aidingensis TaxID=2747607 RepID=UPI001661582C|nr:L,D-transpeptidase family protein [Alkalibacillus aidingensis]
MGRFDSYLKKHLVKVDRNLYLSESDTQYYEKILRYKDPSSPEAHYYLGIKSEQEGLYEKAREHFQKVVKHADSPYYFKSRKSLKRLEDKINASKQLDRSSSTLTSPKKTPLLVKSIISFVIIFNLCILFLLLFWPKPIHGIVSSLKSWDTGVDVVYETVETPYIIYLPSDSTERDVEDVLHREAVELGSNQPDQSIVIYGLKTSDVELFYEVTPLRTDSLKERAFVLAEYHPAIDDHVKIRFLHQQAGVDPPTVIGANLVRTALQTYIEEHGAPPKKVSELVQDYPNNYLSFIPDEPMTQSDEVQERLTDEGGWVYDRHAATLETMFYPNHPQVRDSIDIPFQEIEIMIDPQQQTLAVYSGVYTIAQKPIGVGEEGLTPQGTFQVINRVIEPVGETSGMFGDAGLGIGGDLAIHGTKSDEPIQEQSTLGCIRLTNSDIMDLFDYIPKGTVVTIEEGINPPSGQEVMNGLEDLLPNELGDRVIDQTTDHLFEWAS